MSRIQSRTSRKRGSRSLIQTEARLKQANQLWALTGAQAWCEALRSKSPDSLELVELATHAGRVPNRIICLGHDSLRWRDALEQGLGRGSADDVEQVVVLQPFRWPLSEHDRQLENELRDWCHSNHACLILMRTGHPNSVGDSADYRLQVSRFWERIEQWSGKEGRSQFRWEALLGPPTETSVLRRGKPLRPDRLSDLLAFASPGQSPWTQFAGYNTGVDHFGWQFPDKTLVQTSANSKRIRIGKGFVDVDSGVTLKRLNQVLDAADYELPVVPNYSYVSAGTAFFVPIHGSACQMSTLGQAIQRVTLYDSSEDRILCCPRGSAAFDNRIYDRTQGTLLLRLRFSIQSKRTYRVSTCQMVDATADEAWEALSDRSCDNIEARQQKSTDKTLQLARYSSQTHSSDASGEAFPRDSLGRVWDRIEETPIVSRLFHRLVRKHGFHVELFLDRDQFRVFWDHQHQVSLKKLQYRWVHGDDFPHSPIGTQDKLSVDLFMWRRDRDAFLAFVDRFLPGVRFNPGKHSM